MKKQLTVLLLCLTFWVNAQVFPVQVSPVVVPPYSVILAEYSNAFREQVVVNLLLSDVVANRDVKLVFSLTSNTGIGAQSTPVVTGATNFRLTGGIPLRLTNADIQAYFQLQNLIGITPEQYANPLPDGLYNFCFQVVDARSEQPISSVSCARAFIRQNDPPFLNYPENKTNVEATTPTNIVFNWTPRHLNATNVDYEFTLTELWDEGIDPQTAFQISPPLYQTTTKATTLLYGPAEPALLSNKNYGWRVRAIVNDGISQTSVFKNNGFSEIWFFKYNSSCPAPKFGLSVPKTATSQIIRWQYGEYTAYRVQYRKRGGTSTEWFEERATSYEEALTLYNLEKNTTYEYRIGGQCRKGEDFIYGNTQQFTTAVSSENASGYQCGALPDIRITNQDPLENLGVNEVFLAGDFPVTAKFVEQVAPGRYTGVGFVTVPYLADTRILVKFENIALNTDKQLIDGIVETTYDPDWKGMDDIGDEIEGIKTIGEAITNIVSIGITETAEAITGLIDTLKEKLKKNKDIPKAVRKVIEDELDTLEKAKETFDEAETEEEKEEATEEFEEAKAKIKESLPEEENSNTKDVYVVLDNEKFYDGDSIIINEEELNLTKELEVVGIEKKAKIIWNKIEENDQPLGVLGEGFKITHDLKSEISKFKYGVQYWNDPDDYPQKDKMNEISVNVTIVKSQKFELKDLRASDAKNEKRIAKSGEVLYLVKDFGITSPNDRKRNVNYSIVTTPSLVGKNYNEEDIIWNYNNINGSRKYNYGKININRILWERDIVHTTSVEAGNPEKITKSIDVQFVDGIRSPYEFMLPGTSYVIRETFKTLEDNLKLIEKITQKLGIPKSIVFKLEPIKAEGKTYNEEHQLSRLYTITKEAKITGGVEAELKKVQLTLPALEILSKAGIANIGLYALLKFGVKLEGGENKVKLFNSEDYLQNEKFINIGASGCIEAGLETELLIAKEQINFLVKGFTEGCLTGELNYNFTKEKFTGRIFLPPVVLGAQVEISSKGVLDFDLVDWKKSIEITEEFNIGSF